MSKVLDTPSPMLLTSEMVLVGIPTRAIISLQCTLSVKYSTIHQLVFIHVRAHTRALPK